MWPAGVVFAGAESRAVTADVKAIVHTVRALVSGPDMDTLTHDVAASTGEGSIEQVPAGSTRTLTIQGLNSIGVAIYQGAAVDLTIPDGGVADAGVITVDVVTGSSIWGQAHYGQSVW